MEKMKKQMKLNCRAKRHQYSMFNVERSMFDVHCLVFLIFEVGRSMFDVYFVKGSMSNLI